MPETDSAPAPRRATFAALSFVAMGVLMMQVSLTRVFSLLIWYHFAFLAISLALLGFTGGGVIVSLYPSVREGDVPRRLARLSFGFAAYAVIALAVACRLHFEGSVLQDAKHIAGFAILVLVVLVPFVMAGVIVAATMASYPRVVGKLYYFDLLGSGIGSMLTALVLDRVGGGAGGVLAAGLAGCIAGLLFTRDAGGSRSSLYAVGGALTAAVCLCLAFARQPLRDPFYLPSAKTFPRIARERIKERRCTSVACVDFFDDAEHLGIWGLPRAYQGPLPEQIGIVIDSWALTSIYRGNAGTDGSERMRHPIFEAHPPGLVHRVRRALGQPTTDMLVVGAGGGVDVRTALHFGVEHVEAVDINGSIVDAVKGTYDAYAGGLYRRPDVDVVVAEGRHYIRSSARHYDVIQLSGVDTLAASQAGAFALSENYLYTVEAIEEYVGHLKPGGTVTLTRWLYEPERQTIRLCVIADEGLRRMGLGGAADRVVVIAVRFAEHGAGGFSVILLRADPFSTAELRAVRDIAEGDGWEVLYSPDGRSGPNVFTQYFSAADRGRFIADYPFRIDASTDDAPFFFEHNRLTKLLQSRDVTFGSASAQLMLVVTMLIVLGIMLPFAVVSRLRASRLPGASVAMAPTWKLYFAALGLGYIAVETVLVSRFVLYLGHPVYALSIIVSILLCSSGVGSAISERVVGGQPRRLALVAAAIAALLLLYEVGLRWVFDRTLGMSLPARIAITAALIGWLGLPMGIAFPSGLRRAPPGPRQSGWVAHAWVLNGYASVAGTVGAMFVAVTEGFPMVLFLSACCYVAAAVIAARWPAPERA